MSSSILVKPSLYDKSTDLAVLVARYVRIAEANGWSESVRILQIPPFLLPDMANWGINNYYTEWSAFEEHFLERFGSKLDVD